jgi:MFS family permease
MKDTLLSANPAFRRFWLARTVSYMGDMLARTALLISVFDRHGGSALAFYLLASIGPRLLGPLLGTLADRFDQRRLAVCCDLSQAVIYLSIVVLRPSLPVLLSLVTLAATAATIFTPAGRTLVPALVGRERLSGANAVLAVGVNVGVATGPAVGGLLLGLADLRTALAVDVATFLVSAALIGGIRVAVVRENAIAEPFRVILRSGFAVVRTSHVVRAVSVGMLVTVTFAAMENVALVPLARTDLHVNEAVIGVLSAAFGAGMVLGPLALVRLSKRVRPEWVYGVALASVAGGVLTTGVSPLLVGALVGQTLAGVGGGLHHVAVDTLIQQNVPAQRLGTVFGTVYMFPYAAEALAYILGAPLLAATSPRWVFIVSGAGVLIALAGVLPMLMSATASRVGLKAKAAYPSAPGE